MTDHVTSGARGASPPPRGQARPLTAMLCGLLLLAWHAPAAALDLSAGAAGVLSVSQPQAAEAGARALRQGGDAIDAALAIQAALNVTEPESSGFGGGALLLVWRADQQRAWFIDGREAAPAAATRDQFGQMHFPEASQSGLAVGVPGTLAAFRLAHEQWGRRPFGEDLQAAIGLAEQGFPLGAYVARMLADPAQQSRLDAVARAVFLPDGKPLQAGQTLRQPALARTLRLIAQDPESFYHGPIAAAIVRAQQIARFGPASSGRMQTADLASYQARLRAPLAGHYRDYEVLTAQPPSAGGVTLLETLGLIESTPLSDRAAGFGADSPRSWHRVLEALRLASADRLRYLGDDADQALPVAQLLSPDYLRTRARLITDGVAAAAVPPGEPEKGRNTTHFSVIDAAGNAVLVTSTIEYAWGTGIMVPGFGFLLNNELTDFNLQHPADLPADSLAPNDPAPGRRPRSSMAPTLVLRNGHPLFGIGSPGSATIISTVLQVMLRLTDFGQTLQAAVDAPRFALTSAADAAVFEPGWPPAVLDGLRSLGHQIGAAPLPVGSVQAVAWPGRPGASPQGAADARRDGTVLIIPALSH